MTSLRRILPPDSTLCVCGIRDCGIPFGLCYCGCSQKTELARQRVPARNLYCGFPLQYVNGHNARVIPLLEDEPAFFLDGEPCRWLPVSKGYFFVVDAAKYERLMRCAWSAHAEKKTGKVYATRSGPTIEGTRTPQIPLHRELLNAPRGMEVDHKNGNSFDNRLSNLRLATRRQQVHNRRPNRQHLYKGIHVITKCKAEIRFHGQSLYLGSYADFRDGAIAYDCAARILFGDFAWLNFPDIVNYPVWTSDIRVKCQRALESLRPLSK
jgi:hypothetical protein